MPTYVLISENMFCWAVRSFRRRLSEVEDDEIAEPKADLKIV